MEEKQQSDEPQRFRGARAASQPAAAAAATAAAAASGSELVPAAGSAPRAPVVVRRVVGQQVMLLWLRYGGVAAGPCLLLPAGCARGSPPSPRLAICH